MIRYWSGVIRAPRAHRFIAEGLGIEARYARSTRYWAPHLRCCKEFISAAVQQVQPKTVSVLGSGALYDFPSIQQLNPHPKQICFVDANPLWKSYYRQFGRDAASIAPECAVSWTIGNVEKLPPKQLSAELVISLNLISQLRAMGSSQTDPAGAHLKLLSELGAQAVVLIGDRLWCEYHPEQAAWEVDPACPELSKEFPKGFVTLTGYREVARASWLWHVAPYGIEDRNSGMIHDVAAQLFVRA